ncbi:hypothetical protein Y032_0259g481 [Ancylostoma ceylanicum]|uniref:Uncharacterized protein n=1 Tax=Ancylostoma ceylanicum TaxID=53326 RepID=A0A016SAH9_9BILA|nr:hypothetical protein Y032_0259g481 [Ancylostoma ceylanicum]
MLYHAPLLSAFYHCTIRCRSDNKDPDQLCTIHKKGVTHPPVITGATHPPYKVTTFYGASAKYGPIKCVASQQLHDRLAKPNLGTLKP